MPVLHQHPESSKIRISLLGSSLKIQNSRLIFSSSLPTWGLSLMFYVVYYFTVVLNHAGFSKHSSLLSVAHRLPNYQLHQHSKWDVKEISLLAVLQKFGTLDTHTHTHTHHSSLSQFSHKVEYLLPGLIYLGLGMTKMTLKCLFLSISVQLVSVLYFPEVQQHLIWILKISYRFLVCTFCYIDITGGEWLLGIYILPSWQCHCSFFDSLVSIIW